MWPMTIREAFSTPIPALLDSSCVLEHACQRCVRSTLTKGASCRFLCALQPKDRKAWAQRWRTLIKPGGKLATLIFPVDDSKDRDQGPPFPVTPELYTELLTPQGAHIHFNTLLRVSELQEKQHLCFMRLRGKEHALLMT